MRVLAEKSYSMPEKSPYQPSELTHVKYLWDDATANKLDPVERLRYRSNILGADQRITNTGGGNTSSKITQPDPLTGEQAEVMWVKGSGGDLRTATKANFASLYMDKLLSLKKIYDRAEVISVSSVSGMKKKKYQPAIMVRQRMKRSLSGCRS